MTQAVERIVGRFALVEVIGGSGLAEVYRARDTRNGSEVAVKRLRAYFGNEKGLVDDYYRELERVQRLRHPSIVAPLEMGEDEEGFWVAFPFISWPNLEKSGKSAPFTVGQVLNILRQVAQALEHAHANQVWHGDLKPSNIYLGPDGQVLLADFGMAVLGSKIHPLMQMTIDTPNPSYSAPEETREFIVDAATDIYSLGIIAYELLTGRLPFSAVGAPTVLAQQTRSKPASPSLVNPRLPLACDAVLLRPLALHPLERYQRPGEFVDALDLALTPAPGQPNLRDAEAVPRRPAPKRVGTGVDGAEEPVFCPACGEPNSAEALNCQTCWARLKDRKILSQEQATVLKGFFRREKRLRKGIRIALAAMVLGVVGFFAFDTLYHPKVPLPVSAVSSLSEPGQSAMFGLDPARTGAALVGPDARGEELWRFETTAPLLASPAVVDGVVFQPTGDRRILALNAADGSVLWKHDTTGPVDSSPAVADGLVYYGQRDGHFVALRQDTGDVEWTHKLAPILGGPVVYKGVAYVGGGDGYLHALDAKTGDKLWEFYAGGWIIGGISVNDEVVVAANTSGEVFIINSETGVVRLPYDAITTISGTTALVGDRLYVSTSQGRLSSVNWRERAKPFDGPRMWWHFHFWIWGLAENPPLQRGYLWQVSLGRRSRASSPVVVDDIIYVTAHNGRIVAIDAEDGDKLWERTVTDFLVFSSPAVAGDTVYFGADDGNLYAVNRHSGDTLWTFPTNDRIRNRAVIAEDTVFVASEDGTLYAIK